MTTPTRAFLLLQMTCHHGSGRSASLTCSTARVARAWSGSPSAMKSPVGVADGGGAHPSALLARGSSTPYSRSATRLATSTPDGRQQHERLQQRVVLVGDGLAHEPAEAGVVEDGLDEDRPAEHPTERQREAGHAGQQGVARGVLQRHVAVGQALGLGQPDVVLAEVHDHRVAHAEDPADRRDDEQRHRRQERVGDRLLDEGEVEARASTPRSRPTSGTSRGCSRRRRAAAARSRTAAACRGRSTPAS